MERHENCRLSKHSFNCFCVIANTHSLVNAIYCVAWSMVLRARRSKFQISRKHERKPFTSCMISCMLYIVRFALHKHIVAVVWSQIASRFISCSMGGRTRAQTCTRPDALSMATSNDRTRPLFVDVSGHKPGCVLNGHKLLR